jgi:hypothetical protein
MLSPFSQPGTYAAIYGATVATFPKAMFVMSATLLYFAVLLLSRMRPNIHVPSEEPERAITPPASQEDSEVEDAGEGSHAQARNQSKKYGEGKYDVLQRTSVISRSTQQD